MALTIDTSTITCDLFLHDWLDCIREKQNSNRNATSERTSTLSGFSPSLDVFLFRWGGRSAAIQAVLSRVTFLVNDDWIRNWERPRTSQKWFLTILNISRTSPCCWSFWWKALNSFPFFTSRSARTQSCEPVGINLFIVIWRNARKEKDR